MFRGCALLIDIAGVFNQCNFFFCQLKIFVNKRVEFFRKLICFYFSKFIKRVSMKRHVIMKIIIFVILHFYFFFESIHFTPDLFHHPKSFFFMISHIIRCGKRKSHQFVQSYFCSFYSPASRGMELIKGCQA